MESIYFGVVAFLFLLAVVDLSVGVSNDAVNFLGSAVGARAARFRTIMLCAAAGILCGAVVSNGMMEVARNGIFRPEQFGFLEILCICLAVMVTDVVLLDVFNNLGLPTSTTVSLVFELLGGAFALAVVKLAADDTGLGIADLLNTGKALSVIIGIFLSVAIAFFFGSLVQWIVRLVFTFDYLPRLKYLAGVFGGLAATAIVYFMLIKGLKGSTLLTPDVQQWIGAHTLLLLGGMTAGFTLLMQVLHRCGIDILKTVVLLGTFALAMAFAGNDLVNFVGVPLAGYAAFTEYSVHGGGDPLFPMGALNEPARTPFVFLAVAGVIMIIALVRSKKARNVVRTSVDLSRQGEGDELFGSSAAARSLVRTARTIAGGIGSLIPHDTQRWIDSRFVHRESDPGEGAAFDLVRASVNLLLASLLIALGTSLKLPLSTTYVTFMIAMGTSLADRAWSRESAVFRITGVLSVIGGWFVTAGAAFTLCALVTLAMFFGGIGAMAAFIALCLFLLVRSARRYRRKQRQEQAEDLLGHLSACRDKDLGWNLLEGHVRTSVCDTLDFAAETLALLTEGFRHEDRRKLRKAAHAIDGQKKRFKVRRKQEVLAMRRMDRNRAIERNTWFHLQCNCCEQLRYALKRMCDPCLEHVDNNFTPLPGACAEEFVPLRDALVDLLLDARRRIGTGLPGETEAIMLASDDLRQRIARTRAVQMFRLQHEGNSLNVSLVYLNLLQETEETVTTLRHLLRAANKFHS